MTVSPKHSLLKHPGLWQASQQRDDRPVITTGYTALDRAIYDGGWPQGALTELLLPQSGVGELRLLVPLLSQLSQRPGCIALVAPPFIPYAPYFSQHHIQLNKLLIIRACSATECIWASQQALASRSCSAVICWLPDAAAYKNELRKLTLAARQGQSWGFALRPLAAESHPSPARLRIKMTLQRSAPVLDKAVAGEAKFEKKLSAKVGESMTEKPWLQARLHELEIVKQMGSWHGRKVRLNLLPEQALWTSQRARDWPIYRTREQIKRAEKHLSRLAFLPLVKDDSAAVYRPRPGIVH